MGGQGDGFGICPGVVPVLVGPLQVLLTILPGLLVAVAGALLGLFRPSALKNTFVLLWRQKVAVALLLAAGIGLYWGAHHLWPRSDAGLVSGAQLGTDWPTARGDNRRWGVAGDGASPTRRQVVWTFRGDNETFFASPAVVGNRVYIASAQLGAFSKSGKIHCLDADTGAVVWSNAPADYRPTFSSPVIAGDYLVCGEGLHDTRDARVVCLDLRNKGHVVWTFRTANHVECTPVVADGRVFVGAGDDGVYCLDLKPGPDGQAVMHWHLPAEQFPDAETSLAVHEGKVYVGLGNKGAALVVVDASSGQELQRVTMPYPVFSPAAIADGRLYLGMGNGDYINPGDGGQVVCLDLTTLKPLWTYALPQTALGAVAVKDDKVYFGCSDHHLYCLTRDGKLVQRFDAHAPIKTSPAVTEQHAFVVSETGLLFGLDRHTLEPVWDIRLESQGVCFSSPVVARGHVYVGTKGEGLICVGKPASTKRVPRWSAPLGGPGVAGNADGSPMPEIAEVLWTYPSAEAAAPGTNSVSGSAAIWNDELYLGRRGAPQRGLDCLQLDKNTSQSPKVLWRFSTDLDVELSPVVLRNTVACVDGIPGQVGRKLHFVNRSSGEALNCQGVSPGASGILAATLHQILVQIDDETLTSFDVQGNKEWTATVGLLGNAPASNDTLIIVACARPPRVLALDRATGVELWSVSLTHAPAATPVLEKRAFLLATAAGMEARSLVDGQLLTSWQTEIGVPSSESAITDNQLHVFTNQRGEVIVLNRATGAVAARVPGAIPGRTPLVSRDKVLYLAEGRIMMLPLGQEKPAPELWWEAPGKEAVGSLVLAHSCVFTVLPGRGLVCLGKAP